MRHRQQGSSHYFQRHQTNPYFPDRQEGMYKNIITHKNSKQSKRKRLVQISYSNDQYFPQSNARALTQKLANDSSSNNNSRNKSIKNNFSRNSSFSRSQNGSNNTSRNSSKHSLGLRSDMSREIAKLNAKIISKQRQLNSKQLYAADKLKDNQIIQLYRVVHYYEGKTQQMEKQLKKYQKVLLKLGSECDESTKNRTSIEEMVRMFQQMRVTNQEYLGKIEQKNYQIGMLTDKLRKNQMKIGLMTKFSMRKNDSGISVKKSQAVSNYSRTFSKKSLQEALTNRDSYGNIQSKLNSIELNLKYLQKKNSKLTKQIQQKDKLIRDYQNKLNICHLPQQTIENIHFQNKNQSVTGSSTYLGTTSIGYSKHSRVNRRVNNQEELLNQQRKTSKPSVQTKMKTAIYSKNDPLNKVVFLPKNMLKPIQKPENIKQQSQTPKQQINLNIDQKQQQIMQAQIQPTKSTKLDQIFQQLIKSSDPKVFRKLRLQLMTQQISHQDALNKLLDQQLQPETLQEGEYNLSSEQAEWLIQYISDAKQQIQNMMGENQQQLIKYGSRQQSIESNLRDVLKRVFPSYKDLTLKQQNNLKTHVYNSAMNRLQQFQEFLDENKQKIQVQYDQFEKYFRSWGLLQSHIDVLMKAYYEKTRELLKFNYQQAKNLILSWGYF